MTFTRTRTRSCSRTHTRSRSRTGSRTRTRTRTLALVGTFVCTMAGAGACARDDALDALRGSAQGRVCDEEGEGLVRAPLALHMANGGELAGLTDDNGGFTFARVAYGPASLVFDERELPLQVAPQEVAFVVDTACRPEPAAPGFGAIEGAICNRHTGELLVDATVDLVLANGESFLTATDAEGEFRLRNVPEGAHVLSVRGVGYSHSYAVQVVADATAVLDVGEDCAPGGLEEAPTEAPPADQPPGDEPPADEPPPPPCVPVEEIAGNGVDEDCDGEDAVCQPIEVNMNLSGDCVTTSCPAEAPYPVGCDIHMDGNDGRGCVANTPGDSVVYFQEGDVCGAGHVDGVLRCSALLCVANGAFVQLDAGNCPINKSQPMYPDTRDGCPDT